MNETVEPLSAEDLAFLRQFSNSDPRDVTFKPRMVGRLLATLDAERAARAVVFQQRNIALQWRAQAEDERDQERAVRLQTERDHDDLCERLARLLEGHYREDDVAIESLVIDGVEAVTAEVVQLRKRLEAFERWANPPLVPGAVWPVGDS